MPKWKEMLFGKKEKKERIPLYDAKQKSFMDMILDRAQPGMESGMDYLSSLISGGDEAFENFEAPMRREFEEKTLPSIAERFSMFDAQDSSAFSQSLSQAGAGLSENLAALRESLKSQAMSQLGGMSQMGLGRQFETLLRPATPGPLMGPLFGQAFGGAQGRQQQGGARSMDMMMKMMMMGG